ncbi:hypothetical protein BJ684DRAFT_21188 [Piptocephalis cylindrospora]|uniref:PX domain-containing protein n=1 Tax=Piptocephalis cylindrospora TaxID=1907219 RepID=A0A4P9Y361_9FUNG|nr:hypothetical protein BJ684DRAFT_21188 [Piptocephalis cylindrospora]|eukprot:RKP12260.1 hypothetical protein BJ684DRAFT_21188 [Piptocephalis cylindrospora]
MPPPPKKSFTQRASLLLDRPISPPSVDSEEWAAILGDDDQDPSSSSSSIPVEGSKEKEGPSSSSSPVQEDTPNVSSGPTTSSTQEEASEASPSIQGEEEEKKEAKAPAFAETSTISEETWTFQEQKLVARELLTRQVRLELAQLHAAMSLRSLHDGTSTAESTPTPLLRYIFQTQFLTFPFLQGVEPDFWHRVQRFLDELRRRGLGRVREPIEAVKRRRIYRRIERLTILTYNTAIKFTTPTPALVSSPTDDPASAAFPSGAPPPSSILPYAPPADLHSETLMTASSGPPIHGWSIDIITAKPIKETGRFGVREHTHAEFIISASLNGAPPAIIARRHRDVRALFNALRASSPTSYLPRPPRKIGNPRGYDPNRPNIRQPFRERDRLILRAYLRRILLSPWVSSSDAVLDFFLRDPIRLTQEDRLDGERRGAYEEFRHAEANRVRKETEILVQDMERDMSELRKDLMSPGGTDRALRCLELIERIEDLPPHFHIAISYSRLQFAAFLYDRYYNSDHATLRLQNLKRIHGLIPYRTLRAILAISNPTAMAKAFADLFLARPFGGRSLMQRMVANNLSEEIKECQKDIQATEEAIADPVLCRKIRAYVEDPESRYPDDASLGNAALISRLLQDRSRSPMLGSTQLLRVWPDGYDAGMDGRMGGLLRRFLVLESKRREKEELIQIIFLPLTSDLLKEVIGIFYRPIAQVYKAANIGSYVMDLSSFLDDLIRTIESLDDPLHAPSNSSPSSIPTSSSVSSSPPAPSEDPATRFTHPLDPFTSLIERHQEQMYHFVHMIYSRDVEGIFRQLSSYMDGYQQFLRNGPDSPPIDMNRLIREGLSSSPGSTSPGGSGSKVGLSKDLASLSTYRQAVKDRRRRKLRDRLTKGGEVWDEREVQGMIQDMGLDASAEDVLEVDEEADEDEVDEDLEEGRGRGDLRERRKGLAYKEPAIPEPELSTVPKLLRGFIRELSSRLATPSAKASS